MKLQFVILKTDSWPQHKRRLKDLTYNETLGRRSEILKRNLKALILKNNKHGLSEQESNFYQNMLKELHQNEHELNSSRKQE
jgi:hypothetical protein